MLDHFEVNATTVSRISSPENCLLHHCRFQTKQGTSMTSRRSVTFSSPISFLGGKWLLLAVAKDHCIRPYPPTVLGKWDISGSNVFSKPFW